MKNSTNKCLWTCCLFSLVASIVSLVVATNSVLSRQHPSKAAAIIAQGGALQVPDLNSLRSQISQLRKEMRTMRGAIRMSDAQTRPTANRSDLATRLADVEQAIESLAATTKKLREAITQHGIGASDIDQDLAALADDAAFRAQIDAILNEAAEARIRHQAELDRIERESSQRELELMQRLVGSGEEEDRTGIAKPN